jgi:uncharacterized protein YggU (UPF0235/DUF167 family)
MSKKLEKLLESLGVVDAENVVAQLLADDDNIEIIDSVLKASQSYAKPFIESELNGKFNDERKSLKGKYLKEALLKANKAFGTPLTNKEVEDVLNNPENEGKTYDVAIELLKEKASKKSGSTETELQAMLDIANGKISEFESQIPELETKYKNQYEEAINKFKLDGKLNEQILKVLDGKTSIPVQKAAELIMGQLSKKAQLRLKEDGNIALFDALKDEPLKKNDTTLQTFEGLVGDLVEEYGLAKKSEGTERKPIPTETQKTNTPPAIGATGLAAKMAQVTG